MKKERDLAAVGQPWQEPSEIRTHRYRARNEANLSFPSVRVALGTDSDDPAVHSFMRLLVCNQPLSLSSLTQDVTTSGLGTFLIAGNRFIRRSRHPTGTVPLPSRTAPLLTRNGAALPSILQRGFIVVNASRQSSAERAVRVADADVAVGPHSSLDVRTVP